jgi:hypothetical protein
VTSQAMALSPLSPEALDRLAALRRERRRINHEINEILRDAAGGIATVTRQPVVCLRCGWSWTPHNPLVRPRICARCSSSAWDQPPTASSRKPSDPPPACWRKREGKRRARLQLEPKRIAHRRTKEEIAKDAAEQAEFDMRVANLVTKDFPVRTSPPPRLTAILPPPPSPSAPATMISTALPQEAAMGTLSDWLRSIVTEDSSEPQPERVSSHATPPSPSPVEKPMESVENVETEINVEVVVEYPLAHATLENITVPDDVPPEQVGAPTTDAEREELSRAKEEAWPTTRGDE